MRIAKLSLIPSRCRDDRIVPDRSLIESRGHHFPTRNGLYLLGRSLRTANLPFFRPVLQASQPDRVATDDGQQQRRRLIKQPADEPDKVHDARHWYFAALRDVPFHTTPRQPPEIEDWAVGFDLNFPYARSLPGGHDEIEFASAIGIRKRQAPVNWPPSRSWPRPRSLAAVVCIFSLYSSSTLYQLCRRSEDSAECFGKPSQLVLDIHTLYSMSLLSDVDQRDMENFLCNHIVSYFLQQANIETYLYSLNVSIRDTFGH